MATHYLAYDLGADSGRLILGTLDEGRLTLEEIHRFQNGPVKNTGALYWNLDGIFTELKAGLKKASACGKPIASLSTDSWGVDYALYDERGIIMPPVWCYRDGRTALGIENAQSKVDWPTTYAITGIQFMGFNTLYQIASEPADRLARARQILLIGDAVNHFSSGVARNEVSLASTTQLYDPRQRRWSDRLFAAVGLRENQFAPICASGTRLGPLKRSLSAECGLPSIEVIASCSHDTGAAVAAIPAASKNWAYLSSGTWSLMGVELPEPVISEQSRTLGFTNEIGYGHSVRLLKNIIGLWLVQECRRHWAREGHKFDFTELERMAASSAPFVSLINPDDARFMGPENMPGKIADFCRETGQPVPSTPGATMRCIYESLALFYRVTLRRLEKLTGRKIEVMHIVGGGSKDATLNQFAANAMKIPVLAGPTECAALGNILIQALALSHIPTLDAARNIVRDSCPVQTFNPTDADLWDSTAQRFNSLLG